MASYPANPSGVARQPGKHHSGNITSGNMLGAGKRAWCRSTVTVSKIPFNQSTRTLKSVLLMTVSLSILVMPIPMLPHPPAPEKDDGKKRPRPGKGGSGKKKGVEKPRQKGRSQKRSGKK